ncbi:MAG: hypothetical protein HYV97_01860 [Bdellovibrio sp.]|nr:hypothetical protein [Bdellovibrio sp.]
MENAKQSRGQQMERDSSGRLHRQGVPILINPDFFRKNGAGQVDIAIFDPANGERLIKIYEVKSSRYPSHKQIARLKKSAIILSSLFGISTQIFLLRRYWDKGSFIYKEHLIH